MGDMHNILREHLRKYVILTPKSTPFWNLELKKEKSAAKTGSFSLSTLVPGLRARFRLGRQGNAEATMQPWVHRDDDAPPSLVTEAENAKQLLLRTCNVV